MEKRNEERRSIFQPSIFPIITRKDIIYTERRTSPDRRVNSIKVQFVAQVSRDER
jgi:hypothetical protein